MKRFPLVLALLFVTASVFAANIPAKSELGVSGSYVKAKGGEAAYSFDGQLAVPLNGGGNILLGPKLHYDSDQAKTAVGAVLEVNFNGTAKSGPYVGANGLYNTKNVPEEYHYTVNADAGIKFALSKGGSGFKVFAEKPVAGRGKDEATISYNAGLLVRF
jgi:opacity protein-like surface antigen